MATLEFICSYSKFVRVDPKHAMALLIMRSLIIWSNIVCMPTMCKIKKIYNKIQKSLSHKTLYLMACYSNNSI